MARKFIKCTGLNNIFEIKDGYLDTTTIKSSVSSKVNENSIVFLIANANDEDYGYPNGNKYIWTQKILYSCNDIQIGVDSSNYLSISSENGVNILDISVGSLEHYEDGGLATVEDVYNVIKEDEEIIAGTIADLRNEIIENEEVVASAIAKINNEVNSAKQDISTLDEVVSYALTDLDYRIKNVDNNVSILNADVNSIKDQVVIINTSINTINSDIQNISTQLFDSSIILSKGITLNLIDEIKTDSSLPTSKAVIEYVNNKLAGGVTFKGEFIPNTSTTGSTGDGSTFYELEEKVGDMYVASAAGTFLDTSMEAGDAIIFKVDISTDTYVASGQVSFVEATTDITAYNPTLNFGQTSKIATIEGRDLNVTLPEVDVDDFVTKSQLEEVEEVIATHINNFADGVGVDDNYKVEWSASSGIPVDVSTIKDGIEYVATHASGTDEKIKVSTSTTNAGFPLIAVATSSPTNGSTYEGIYDSGIVINPSLHSVATGYNTTASGTASHAEGQYVYATGEAAHAEGMGATKGNAIRAAIKQLTNDQKATTLNLYGIQFNFVNPNDDLEDGMRYDIYSDDDTELTTVISTITVAIFDQWWSVSQGDIFNVNNDALNTLSTSTSVYYRFVPVSSAATGKASHIEGYGNNAFNDNAHVEGKFNTAFNDNAHVEGDHNSVLAHGGHAEGTGVIVGPDAAGAHAEGTYTFAIGQGSHAEGNSTIAKGQRSHAEGLYSITGPNALGAHAEGQYTNALGTASHAGGFHTIADNDYMTAIGKYNASINGAIFALGIGTAENARENAHLVTTNGNHYIKGIGGYNGTQTDLTNVKDLASVLTDSEPMESITWSALKTKRDGSTLIPGKQYRITDYTCTTREGNTRSAEHVFDVIVVADSTNTLNENARAIQHSGDTYFRYCNLEAWELKYCIDNDINRFEWADPANGKGVIYWMKDEFNNECPYDFKNIQFYIKTDGSGIYNTLGNYRYVYTFNFHDWGERPGDYDNSIKKYYCVNNTMKLYLYRLSNNVQVLNRNILLSNSQGFTDEYGDYHYSSDFSCKNNYFGYDCHDNIFGSQASNNRLDDGCTANVFHGSNAVGIFAASYITFDKDCNDNKISFNTYHVTLGGNCQGNIINTKSSNIKLGSSCQYIMLPESSNDIIVEDGNKYITLNAPNVVTNEYFRNVKICHGVNNTATIKIINDAGHNQTYQTIYQPSDSQIISV